MNESLRAILQAVSEDDELKAQATALMASWARHPTRIVPR